MQKHAIYSLVFSSTAALYGDSDLNPSKESDNTFVTNPIHFQNYLSKKF